MKPSNQTIITNPNKLQQTIQSFQKAGAGTMHVLADFDRTLTTAMANGKSVPSLISILRDHDYLTPDYPAKAHALYQKYSRVESDPSLTIEQKKAAMREWWTKHFELLIASGLKKQDIQRAMGQQHVQLRPGAEKLFHTLHQFDVPLVIMSSSGLGEDSIIMYLESRKLLLNNIHVISNRYEWGAAGQSIGVQEPIIHSFNKDETVIQDYPAFKVIKKRKNVLLLGDGLGDPGMVTGFAYKNLITIGFLNDHVGELLEQYQSKFDVVITHDGPMDYVNELLEKIMPNKSDGK